MIRSPMLAALLTFALSVHGKDHLPPCHTKSRQMTMVKNCFTGDMIRPVDGGGQFFEQAPPTPEGVAYCYNSLVMVEHGSSDTQVQIHVLKDTKDGQLHAYNFSIPPEDVKKIKKDTPYFSLKGLKGSCFSPTGDKEICNGGILKALGWKDTDAPMVVAIGKAAGGQYTVSHLVSDSKDLATHPAKELELSADQDLNKVNSKLLQEIRRKLVLTARTKLSQMRSPGMTPQKLSATSEQFRFCSMALEGFLKSLKLNDPFSPDEKMTLAALTNYMNNDASLATQSRLPASNTPPPKRK